MMPDGSLDFLRWSRDKTWNLGPVKMQIDKTMGEIRKKKIMQAPFQRWAKNLALSFLMAHS